MNNHSFMICKLGHPKEFHDNHWVCIVCRNAPPPPKIERPIRLKPPEPQERRCPKGHLKIKGKRQWHCPTCAEEARIMKKRKANPTRIILDYKGYFTPTNYFDTAPFLGL